MRLTAVRPKLAIGMIADEEVLSVKMQRGESRHRLKRGFPRPPKLTLLASNPRMAITN